MAKLSLYTTGMDTPHQEMPWDFWTDEEKSYVIWQGYDKFLYKSAEVEEYLKASRWLNVTNWLFPVVSYATFLMLRRNVLKVWNRKFNNAVRKY